MINKYTLAPKINYVYFKRGKEYSIVLACYPSNEYFNKKKKFFNNNCLAPIEIDTILKSRINFSKVIRMINQKCGVISCENDAQEMYHIQDLSFKSESSANNNFYSSRLRG